MSEDDFTVTIQDESGDPTRIKGTVKAVKGPPGPPGAKGDRGSGVFRQFAVIAVFVLMTALVLGYLVQQGRDYTVEQCHLRREAVIHQNMTWKELTKIEQIPIATTSAASAERIRQRIKIYADAQVPVPDCEKR